MRIFEKKCNDCKRALVSTYFFHKDKVHARCNDCSLNSSNKKNICEVCGIRACFNIKGLSWGKFCNFHKEVGMVNVMSKKCVHSGCTKQPTFNVLGKNEGLYCSDHKEVGMIDVRHKKCVHSGCTKIPTYNVPGENKGLYCSDHKEVGMADVRHKKCVHSGCTKQPIFNTLGENEGLYCSEHKEVGMVNVKNKKCVHSGCTKQPIFNVPGEKVCLYCSEHKEVGMIDIKHKKCVHTGCKTRPNFNFPGINEGLYCSEHKEDGMIDVNHKKCVHTGCKKRPNFNFPGVNEGLYCIKHKEDGMIDVNHKKCVHTGCKKRPLYGYCCTTITHCSMHKLYYMISTPNRVCVGNDEEECKDFAIYGKTEPTHCEDHSTSDEVCFLVKKCNNCCRDNEILNKEGLCNICCDIPFFEETKRLHKMKETTMVRFIKANIKLSNNIKELPCDNIVNRDCNMYRPDLPYDCGTHILVIECDEDQHKGYNWQSCCSNKSLQHSENKRMYEIMLAYEGLPVIFLRWNPDNFRVKNIVCKKYNMNKRLEILKKWVEYCMTLDILQLKQVQYKKLFYDDYEEGDMSFKVINENELI